ncbi:MAG: sulfite exporter TauE/SafE family protein [Candidatus Omnitrophota bacterium]
MEIHNIIFLSIFFYLAGIVGVSVGGTSLITVPLLISMGMSAKLAVGTNMFTLIFVSLSGAIGFRESMETRHNRVMPILIVLTILGSWWGAKILLDFDEKLLERFLVLIICLFVPIFLLKKNIGITENHEKNSPLRFFAASVLVFILGIYGGFFSGGYVMMLSYVLILGIGFDFLQTAGMTKVLNLFSSLVASLIFWQNGLIDLHVGIPLAVAISLGGYSGAKLAIRKGNVWVRRLFIGMMVFLAVKLFLRF